MTVPLYDTCPYTDPVPRLGDWRDVWCRVTWTPRQGDAVAVTGGYLDARGMGGAVSLGCGFAEAVDDIGLGAFVWSDEHIIGVCSEVDRQLAMAPTATLRCPLGVAVIELVSPTG